MEVILVWFGFVLFFLSFDYFGVVAIMKPENGNFSSGGDRHVQKFVKG